MTDPSFSLRPSKETLTAQSGLALFGKFCQRIGLSKTVREQLPPPGSNRGYHPDAYVLPLVMMLHAGGRYLEDIRAICKDKGLCRLLKIKTIPEAGSIGDWLRRMGENEGIDGLANVNKWVIAQTLHSVDHKKLTLDIDATGIVAHKFEAQYTYKKFKGYMPIVGHIAENGAVVAEEFRAGNVSPATDNLAFIKSCVSQLPEEKCFASLRADAASYQSAIIKYCEDQNMTYAIGGKMSKALLETIQRAGNTSWKPYVDRHGVKTDSQITTVSWSMEQSTKPFSMIVLRTVLEKPDLFETGRYKYHIVATNRLEEDSTAVLHWYSERGEHSENRIKELKNGFSLDYMPCGTQGANAVFFRIGVLAYNLFILFKREVLGKRWLRSQIQTVRLHVYNLPGKIVRTARMLCLRIPESFFLILKQIKERIEAIPAFT